MQPVLYSVKQALCRRLQVHRTPGSRHSIQSEEQVLDCVIGSTHCTAGSRHCAAAGPVQSVAGIVQSEAGAIRSAEGAVQQVAGIV